MNKEKMELIDLLIEDVQAQLDALTNTQDVCWSPYEPDNWRSMLSSLADLKQMEQQNE